MKVEEEDGKNYPLRDKRYTITLEFTGHISGKPRYVLRWCEGQTFAELVGDFAHYSAAVTRAVGHKAVREGALVIEEKTE